jgi:hypothetical protein
MRYVWLIHLLVGTFHKLGYQETHYVSGKRTTRLMLFREIITVEFENHIKHTNAFCLQNGEF